MVRCYSIVLSIYLFCSSIYASNDWSQFEAHDIYPVADKSNCVFPFTYKDKVYNDCTTDGDNGNLPWCSLTSTYQGIGTYCYNFWNSTLQCLPKFTINGKTYTQCDYLSKTAMYKQCKTNNSAAPYRYCIEDIFTKSGRSLNQVSSCDPAYKALSPFHTTCYGPSNYAIPIPITPTEKQELLDMHNAYRANTSARYMFKLYWDDELAKIAQNHSDMCFFDHDLAANRYSTLYNWKNGQNMVMTNEIRSGLADLLDMMFSSEIVNFVYGTGCAPDPGTCLHYTQGVLNNMTRVGCAHTHCVFPDRIERYLTCNYILSQYTNNYMIPYVPSKVPAVDCPSKAVGNLCDCGNKICNYNNGEYLDPATCDCKTPVTKRSIGEQDPNSIKHPNSNEEPFVTMPPGKKIGLHAPKNSFN
ncbi:unnamed protein product [Rotaria socialis]|uniref:Fibronectin type-II domain-containing protein n=1 Tax=Rotaria socialis TaxID=392032 RepID=A0A817SAU8_9BILA|nr:unnamed protein product [Rotaria socialis]CAF4168350.1 unnamed protein product [Rotaria socialis]